MRIRTHALIPAAAMVAALAIPATAQDDKAAQVLAAVRNAIGGQKIHMLKTLAVDASLQRNVGAMQVSADLELLLELPDKYVRTEQGAGPMGGMTMGFNGDAPIKPANASFGPGGAMMIRFGPGGPMGGPADTLSPEEQARADQQLLHSQRAEISRLMLGWLGMAHPASNARYTYAGEAESPDGKAHVIDASNAEGFSARLFVDTETHLPLMVTYQGPQPRVMTRQERRPEGRGRGRAPEMSEEEARKARVQALQDLKGLEGEPPPTVEMRLFFEDWRRVDGVQFPHKIRRAAAGVTHEEWTVNTVRINPRLDPKKFQG